MKSISRALRGAGLTVALALIAACGSSSSSGTATMNVHLVDGPSLEYTELWLNVQEVRISQDGGGWITLGEPNRTVNLLSLTGGVVETLVDGKSIPAGTYGQLRLVLGRTGNRIRTADGQYHDLTVPSGMQSGVKLNVHFVVAPDTTKDIFIDFDAHRSIFVHETGASQKYILRPVVRAFDRIVTGAVKGKLTDAATQAPLADVEVLGETLDSTGAPAVVRTTRSAADGTYTLDLLPVGASYWVVAQPRPAGVVYEANAAGAFPVTVDAPVVAGKDLAFAKASGSGTIQGAVTPAITDPLTQSDEVTLLGTVAVATVDRTFVLRTQPASVSGGAESYQLDLLPPASYSLFVTRATADGAGGFTYADGPTSSATVTSGATTTADLSAP
jgi:hypothetical protein